MVRVDKSKECACVCVCGLVDRGLAIGNSRDKEHVWWAVLTFIERDREARRREGGVVSTG